MIETVSLLMVIKSTSAARHQLTPSAHEQQFACAMSNSYNLIDTSLNGAYTTCCCISKRPNSASSRSVSSLNFSRAHDCSPTNAVGQKYKYQTLQNIQIVPSSAALLTLRILVSRPNPEALYLWTLPI